MNNRIIADRFNEIADRLERSGANPFRIGAYRKASRSLSALTRDVSEILEEGSLKTIPGIGADLASKIQEFLKTGQIPDPEPDDRSGRPDALPAPLPFKDLTDAGFLDPRLARLIADRFLIQTVDDLERLVRSRLLRTLPQFGPGTEQKILEGLASLPLRPPSGGPA
jgi:DNA polymerase (family X)